MSDKVKVEFSDGEVREFDFPTEEEIFAMHEFSQMMLDTYMPNLDEILRGP